VSEDKVSFENQVIVITGAARGIGTATARLIAARGGKVFALDIAKDGLNSLQKELGLPADQVIAFDLGNQSAVKATIDSIYSKAG
jgi:NADP-dependent 3-hydroxy acid dehydrogenase YdfG